MHLSSDALIARPQGLVPLAGSLRELAVYSDDMPSDALQHAGRLTGLTRLELVGVRVFGPGGPTRLDGRAGGKGAESGAEGCWGCWGRGSPTCPTWVLIYASRLELSGVRVFGSARAAPSCEYGGSSRSSGNWAGIWEMGAAARALGISLLALPAPAHLALQSARV